ncbi:hypothetical protein [Winogradskyella immobilis]|uniref:Carboxypeptidase-like regulatory domain-containing protein n=1 Tax=Winogradskyella immobilis TaxID=2816852 RepID=A0ABS8EPM7_9FLAO|nr:hypothetical protein [Winogradskyella immobilis]MCC1484520.1 hypothetical protein [Winogradskyella immobilis]MCG0016612.1 hypothetical protein [Winogradskyella immobilis]
MAKRFIFILCFSFSLLSIAQITIKDSQTKSPVSYATVSFGNGNGIFADDAGVFIFNKKLYPDIDSLFISALGYKNIDIATKDLPQQLFLEPYANELDAVIIGIKRKFKTEKIKPYLDDDYYKCWLPTIESEIAVFFPNNDNRLKRIASVKFPIALESRDWKKRKKSNSDKKSFSTLFKVNFYENENGKPGQALTFETIVFRATEKDGDFHELNVSEHDIFIPKAGVFVSLQVLGYTDKFGKLLPNKKYKEIKGKSGIVKIPTNFRPLLPFTNEISENRTYIKRVFINENNWVQFKKGNDFSSSLLKNGLNNYGIGMNLNIFKDE